MCCLFGLLDYKGVFSTKEKNRIISVMSTEAESRGIDATGISYNANGRLSVFKRPLAAHLLRYAIPDSSKYIMGHTRMTTQGSEKKNYNNHPFIGFVGHNKFALAHNGMIYNDSVLRETESLPITKIQTDSYIAIQLIEQKKTLDFGSLKYMAEKLEGSFCFTVLDREDNLYVVKGNNPFILYHFPKQGFYLYASTDQILTRSIKKLGMEKLITKNIHMLQGDILKINKQGKIKMNSFDDSAFYSNMETIHYSSYTRRYAQYRSMEDDTYLQDLKAVAFCYGYSEDDVEEVLSHGFSCEEIEEMLYVPDSQW